MLFRETLRYSLTDIECQQAFGSWHVSCEGEGSCSFDTKHSYQQGGRITRGMFGPQNVRPTGHSDAMFLHQITPAALNCRDSDSCILQCSGTSSCQSAYIPYDVTGICSGASSCSGNRMLWELNKNPAVCSGEGSCSGSNAVFRCITPKCRDLNPWNVGEYSCGGDLTQRNWGYAQCDNAGWWFKYSAQGRCQRTCDQCTDEEKLDILQASCSVQCSGTDSCGGSRLKFVGVNITCSGSNSCGENAVATCRAGAWEPYYQFDGVDNWIKILRDDWPDQWPDIVGEAGHPQTLCKASCTGENSCKYFTAEAYSLLSCTGSGSCQACTSNTGACQLKCPARDPPDGCQNSQRREILHCIGDCKLDCSSSACADAYFKCPANGACEVQSTSTVGPSLVDFNDATKQGALINVQSNTIIEDTTHTTSCSSDQWRCPLLKADTACASAAEDCKYYPTCGSVPGGIHNISDTEYTIIASTSDLYGIPAHTVDDVRYDDADGLLGIEVTLGANPDPMWRQVMRVEKAGLQEINVQRLGALCVLSGHIRTYPLAGLQNLANAPLDLGRVPEECRPACRMCLFSGVATLDLEADGTLRLTSTQIPIDHTARGHVPPIGNTLNLNSIAWTARGINTTDLALTSGDIWVHEDYAHSNPRVDVLNSGGDSPLLCVLSGVLRLSIGEVSAAVTDPIIITTLPYACRITAARQFTANLQWEGPGGFIHKWEVNNLVSIEPNGAVTLSVQVVHPGMKSAKLSLDGIGIAGSSIMTRRSSTDLGDGQWTAIHNTWWECETTQKQGCALSTEGKWSGDSQSTLVGESDRATMMESAQVGQLPQCYACPATCPSGMTCEPCVDDLRDCSICDAGFYSPMALQECLKCPIGRASAAGSSECDTCPAGKSSVEGSDACVSLENEECSQHAQNTMENMAKHAQMATNLSAAINVNWTHKIALAQADTDGRLEELANMKEAQKKVLQEACDQRVQYLESQITNLEQVSCNLLCLV